MGIKNRSMEKAMAWQRGDVAAMEYHKKVTDFDAYTNTMMLNRFRMAFLKYFSEFSEKAIVLDMGTGTGIVTSLLEGLGINSVGVDISMDMLAVQKKQIPYQNLVRGSVFGLPFSDGAFDAVVSRWVLGHFPDWLQIVVAVHRTLKDGGLFIFDFANQDNLALARSVGAVDDKLIGVSSSPGDVNFSALCPSEMMRAFLENIGFSVVEISPCDIFCENYLMVHLFQDRYKEYAERVDALFRSKAGKEFLFWLDTEMTQHLPLKYARRMIVVARKKAPVVKEMRRRSEDAGALCSARRNSELPAR